MLNLSGKKQIMGVALGVAVGVVLAVGLIFLKISLEKNNKTTEYRLTATDSKRILLAGNERFINGKLKNQDISESKKVELLEAGQHPIAAILGCSDSRVPPELLFDQGLGDLFVIRDAGNVVDAMALGSIEYAVEHLKVPLIVVLGHEKCSAVKAAVDGGGFSENLSSITEKIKPALEEINKQKVGGALIYDKTESQNVRNMVAQIKKSPIVEELVKKDELTVVGAKYHIETGDVYFFPY